ncbi:MAG: hypothetical protein V3W11_05535 [bacterium]
MRSENAHMYSGRGSAGKGGAASARAACSSLRRELRIWYRRLARRLRSEPACEAHHSSGRP